MDMSAKANHHPHIEVFRRTYAASTKGDMKALAEVFAEDVVWHTRAETYTSETTRALLGMDFSDRLRSHLGKYLERSAHQSPLEVPGDVSAAIRDRYRSQTHV
jgi:ketosteroid isomerase-like protein